MGTWALIKAKACVAMKDTMPSRTNGSLGRRLHGIAHHHTGTAEGIAIVTEGASRGAARVDGNVRVVTVRPVAYLPNKLPAHYIASSSG